MNRKNMLVFQKLAKIKRVFIHYLYVIIAIRHNKKLNLKQHYKTTYKVAA